MDIIFTLGMVGAVVGTLIWVVFMFIGFLMLNDGGTDALTPLGISALGVVQLITVDSVPWISAGILVMEILAVIIIAVRIRLSLKES